MSGVEATMKRLVACWGVMIALCWPVCAETPIPDRERLEVANALSWQTVIPATANAPGRFGAYYKTRVVIFNPTSRDYSITARLYGTNGPVSQREIAVDASEYLVWDNFLGEVFDYTGGGAVWLKAPAEDDQFYMTAEVYTDSPNGRFSTTVVSGIVPKFVSSSKPDFNVGVSVNRKRRTNIGVWNWEAVPSSVEAKVFNASGSLLETVRFQLKGEAWQQKTITVPVDNGLVRWEINGDSRTHYFYAVEVDNASNDGTLTWSVKASIVTGGGGIGDNVQTPDCAEGSVIQPGRACNLTVGGNRVGTFSVDTNSSGCIRVGGITSCSSASHNYRGARLDQYVVTFVASKREDGSWEITMYSISG